LAAQRRRICSSSAWCKDYRHQVEDPAEMAERCGAATTLLDWRDWLCVRAMWQRNVESRS
jgi:hypothetical protein